MYYGSDELNNAIENTQGNALKTRLKFSDEEIIELVSSMRYYGGSNDSDDLMVGNAVSAYVDVTAFTDKSLAGREFLLESGVKLSDGTYEYAPIGYFTVQTPNGDYDEVSFTAYDRMIKFEKVYSSGLTYPTDSAKALNEICTMCGVTLATPITNPVTITENLKGYTCREVLGYIAGIHGFFACIDRFGELNLRWYSDAPVVKELRTVWAFEKSQEQYEVEKVEVAKDIETSYTSGDGVTTLYHSNPYATQEITDKLFKKLGGYKYMPAEIEMLDDIRLDPWDVVSVTYYDNIAYLLPCMSIVHDFGASSTTIKSVGKTSVENEYKFTGPTTQYLNRMSADLLVANKLIATKVDAEYVNSVAITTENFDAKVAEIKELIVDEIDGKYANIDLANIDIANINVGKIGELFAKVGLIDRATIVEGHITGFLDAVEVNANKITAGTLIADRILLSGGDKGVLYALNNLGELTSSNVDTLDGYVLTDRTINADKLIANSITANELDVNQIFGNEAVLNKIVSQDAFIDAIETNRIIVGASENASKALQEVNKTVKSITMHYLATTLASGVTISTSGWTTTVQQIDATKKYLWTYQTITYVDNTTTDTSPVISGVYGNEGKDGKDGIDGAKGDKGDKGDTGEQGVQGATGATGVGVTSVVPLYYLKSNTTAPSAPTSAITSTAVSSGVWTKAVPTYVANYTYFTCTQTQYNNGTYGWSTVVADNALTNANKTATTANTNASNAVSTANTANTNASNAVSTANTANSTATTANNTANAIKNNIYYTGTTLIDGGKIYTDTLFSKDINITGTFKATAQAFINPTSANVDDIASRMSSLTAAEIAICDMNKSGTVNIQDIVLMKKLQLGMATVDEYETQYGYSPKLSDVTVSIKPSDARKAISCKGINAWGTEIDNYFGIEGLHANLVKANSVSADVIETTSGANLDTINSNLSTKLSAKIITRIVTLPTSGNLIIDYPTGVTHATIYTVFVSLTYEEGEYYGTAIAPSYGTNIDLGSKGATIILTNDALRGKTVWLHYLVTG